MTQAQIVKTALKLEKFKILLAHTISTGLTFAPAMGSYVLVTSSFGASHFLNFTSGIAGMLMGVAQIAMLIYKHTLYSGIQQSVFRPAHNVFWKEALNKPFIALFKKANEDIILKTRKMLQQSHLTQEDYDWLSQTISEKDLLKKDLDKWVKIIRQHNDYYGNYHNNFLKEENTLSALKAASEVVEKTNPGYIASVVENKKHNELLKFNLALSDFVKHDSDYPTQETRNLIETKTQILLNPKYEGLKPRDYAQFKAIVKTESTDVITNALKLLSLADYPKVDWAKIQELLQNNYKSHTRSYLGWCETIDKKLITQHSLENQAQILSSLDAPALTPLASPQESEVLPLSPIPLNALDKNVKNLDKFCSLVNYQSSILPDAWHELREEYKIIFNLKERLANQEFIEFNSQLNTVLPLLIGVDVSFKSSNQNYPEQSVKLVQENLEILILKAQTINELIKHSLNRDLEVASRYQNNKKMSASA